jgi:DNA-binding NarL/FixJ family response regulator
MTVQGNDNTSTVPAPRRSGGLPIHVLVVDDHPAVRHGIIQLLAAQADLVPLGESDSPTEATIELARWADVAVIDYHLGDRDGLWLTQQIKHRPSAPPVLIYSAFADVPLATAAIVAGADGMVSKSALAEELTIAIRRLFHGRQYFPAIPESISAALCSRLEPRDRAIFSMLIHGLRPQEVAARLGITRSELEARRQVILRAIAPHAAPSQGVHTPLDYERPRRRPRFPAGR